MVLPRRAGLYWDITDLVGAFHVVVSRFTEHVAVSVSHHWELLLGAEWVHSGSCDHGVGREISAGHVHVALRGVDVGEAERAGTLGAVSTYRGHWGRGKWSEDMFGWGRMDGWTKYTKGCWS